MIHELSEKTKLYLPEGMQPDRSAIQEWRALMELEETWKRFRDKLSFPEGKDSGLEAVVLTPDFHKGAGIPIGTVLLTKGFLVPQAMGNDINCGMRFYTTDLKEDMVRRMLPELTKKIRHIFFEGGRNIPMTGIQREAMFREGLKGILETNAQAKQKGIWQFYEREEQDKELCRVAFQGSLRADETEGLSDFIGEKNELSYDDQIGSVGGGNHFVEMQQIKEIYDGQTAAVWGIKKGAVCVMIHTGSLTIGHHSGLLSREICQEVYPPSLGHPLNKIYPLPDHPAFQKQKERFWNAANNAANFAFANRLFLGLMLWQACAELCGSCKFQLLYDSPHNFIWKKEVEGEYLYIHRKGACSANGVDQMIEEPDSPFAYYGEPIMLPGSMGSSSYLLRGNGNSDALWSASHGAGRRLSRGEAIHGNDAEFQEFMKRFSIITPIDPERSDLRGRRDILDKWEGMLRAEAPYAYKDIDQIIAAHEEHRLALPVARMEPIFTIKA